MKGSGVVRLAWLAGIVFFVVFGVWPFLAPRSFYDAVATFPPYNAHFLRDAGAFTLGVAGALVAAWRWRDGLLVALTGASAASVLHVISHIVDADKGGKPTDIPLLSLLALVLIAGTIVRAKEVRE
jgi:hypothetical protein